MKYTSEVSLGNNVGNIRRIENLADIQMNQKIQQFSASLDKAKNDLEEAKSNVSKPFERAGELEEMTKRLEVVNAELSKSHVDDVDEPAYDLKKAVASVIAECGAERVSNVLADYIHRNDYDGRISHQDKEWAREFEVSTSRYGPVFDTHPAVLDGFISEARVQIKELEKVQEPKLSSIYDDRFLLSTERVELKDDYRGIPETKYFNSSVNEYFVDKIGWLDNAAYDYEQKSSNLSAKDFYANVEKINANYIDAMGKTGQMDMTKQEYDLLTEKTYAAENKDAFEAAKAKLQERKREAGVVDKPIEYYAVRQMNDRKFAVCSISADGLVTVAKPHITTIAEAKKAMLEIFERKKSTIRCEFIHPQTLDEKSAEIFKGQSKELPEVTYRICLNTNKAVNDTHFLQKYSKNADDTYKIDSVVCRGDYDKCNAALSETLQPDFQKQFEEQKKPDFEIYQIKGGESTHDIRFEPYDRLIQHGGKVDFNSYDKAYEGSNSILPSNNGEIDSKLEAVYMKFNLDHPENFKGHSLSVSDVVIMDDKAYYVDSVGFKPLKEFKPTMEKQQEKAAPVVEQEKAKSIQQKKIKM